jgi:hypothetical protein
MRTRLAAGLAALAIAVLATTFGMPRPAQAAPTALCTTQEWGNPANLKRCVNSLGGAVTQQTECMTAPVPSAPDSGMAGWFAEEPASYARGGRSGLYSSYGYAGYDFSIYDLGCGSTVVHPELTFENTVADGEFLVATSVVGAANALRTRAWDPGTMWGWADPLVERVTRALYDRVFTVFGTVTLAIVGLYLLWRSRQADMNHAATTAAWALMVAVLVTAVAQWPTRAANLADGALTGALASVHAGLNAANPNPVAPGRCIDPKPGACDDRRTPAQRTSDVATEGLVYRNWLRGQLGSADSPTAKKYGLALYDAKAMTWGEAGDARRDPAMRAAIIKEKNQRWMKVAAQVKTEDPEAYEYLQGSRGLERVGAGFVAILASLSFAAFDLAASLLVLIGFLVFRWAVIAVPVVGTVALLRPASGGLRRLTNVVVAATFNIVIFGIGASVYLFAVDLILGTRALPGWLQVLLILLTGWVGWAVLRPYRRLSTLGNRDPVHAAGQAAQVGAAVDRALVRRARDLRRTTT